MSTPKCEQTLYHIALGGSVAAYKRIVSVKALMLNYIQMRRSIYDRLVGNSCINAYDKFDSTDDF